MIDHRRFLKLAAGAVDFGLRPAQRTELDLHLTSCLDCRQVASRLHSQAIMLRDRPRALAPATLRRRVESEWLSGGTRVRSRDAFRLALMAAATLIAIIGLGALGVGRDARQNTVAPSATIASAPVRTASPPSIPPIGQFRSVSVPAGTAAHEHLCHVIVVSDCAADVAFADGSVWTTTSEGVVRVDPTTEAIVARIPVGAFPHRLVFAAGSMWVTLVDPATLVRIDTSTNTVTARVPVGATPSGVAPDTGGVWVADSKSNEILYVDAMTNSVSDTIAVAGGPTGVALSDGELWVTHGTRSLSRIDRSTDRLSTTVDLPGSDQVGGATIAGGTIWVLGHDNVKTYDLVTGEVGQHFVPNFPKLIVEGNSLWIASAWNRTVQHLDGGTFAILSQQSLPIDQSQWETAIAVGAGSIWIRDYEGDQLLRLVPNQ